jgi:tetratricopeptide (TPR) repeat protein
MDNLEMMMQLLQMLSRDKPNKNSSLASCSSYMAKEKKKTKNVGREIEKRASEGSLTAKNYLESKRLIAEGLKLLKENDEAKWPEAVSLFRQSYRLNNLFVLDEPRDMSTLKVYRTLGESNSDAMFMLTSQHEAHLSLRDGIEHCKKCTKLYPEDAEFWFALGSWYGFAGDYANGYKYCSKAFEMAPERHDWLFQVAGALRMYSETCDIGDKHEEALGLYQKYVDLNGPDARSVPNAYYCMSLMHAFKDDIELAQEFYNKGMQAEKVRLPCFEEIGEDYDPKTSAKLLIDAAKRAGVRRGNHGPREATNRASSTERVTCDHCSKKLGCNTFECEKCKEKRYCSQNCLKKNTKVHKLQCKEKPEQKEEA